VKQWKGYCFKIERACGNALEDYLLRMELFKVIAVADEDA
jgi:hypothetical protein